MKKIIVYGLTERRGGIESFFLNYKEYLSKFHLDYIKVTPNKLSYEGNFKNSKIFYVPMRKEDAKLRRSKIKEIFNTKEYDALWFNSNDLASIDIIKEAKKAGIKCIGHAHNSRTDRLDRSIRHNINKRLVNKDFDGKFACSISAANWFYTAPQEANIIYNAINVDKYLYDKDKRKKIRDKYNIPDDFMVLGDIGRLEKQKNITYLIDVFEKYHRANPKSCLMIVGTGSKKDSLHHYVEDKSLQSSVIFTGEVDNTRDYLSAFDIFLMPSLYEGLPVTLVEAQAAGLKCIVADNITHEVNVTKNIKYLPIEKESINLWVENILKSNNRVTEGKKLKGSVFDITKSANYLENKILEVIN